MLAAGRFAPGEANQSHCLPYLASKESITSPTPYPKLWLMVRTVPLRSFGRRRLICWIDANHARQSIQGRHYSGEVILLAVRWYLRYPLAYEHVAEMLAERGLEVDASCVWRWVQARTPELNKRCRPHLRPTNKSYRIDETS